MDIPWDIVVGVAIPAEDQRILSVAEAAEVCQTQCFVVVEVAVCLCEDVRYIARSRFAVSATGMKLLRASFGRLRE
jgi:hypothetical protein